MNENMNCGVVRSELGDGAYANKCWTFWTKTICKEIGKKQVALLNECRLKCCALYLCRKIVLYIHVFVPAVTRRTIQQI